MTYKVGPKGQVLLPKALRDRLGIEPGYEVTVEEVDGEIRIRPAAGLPRLRGMLADVEDSLTAAREAERRRERSLGDDKPRRWTT